MTADYEKANDRLFGFGDPWGIAWFSDPDLRRIHPVFTDLVTIGPLYRNQGFYPSFLSNYYKIVLELRGDPPHILIELICQPFIL